ncbi:hypothetical protein [Xylophilus sp. Leaf220]|jgi:uncharacterized membrane protein|uniref:hypothetical protein n=1 Tax=Xylophilus sp. Leaf220 TaxID=1735686 RepID=UPI0006FD4396|nr:hypothetical protein [Xylophilus sp. Leaf220]KQM79947.1 hypothetical protein ASE76_01805 [Xylophilus sp. Leaf220]
MGIREAIEDWQQFDRVRPGLPGEHLAVAGIGTALVVAALRTDCKMTSVLQAMAGGALLFRAASGRDGISKLFRDHRPEVAMRRDAIDFGLD